MSEEKAQETNKKPEFTLESIENQIRQTQQDLLYFQNKVQQMVGILEYLAQIKQRHSFLDKAPVELEVKQ